MVRTLKRKFIIVIMISVTAVFLIIMGIINIVNYNNVISNANQRLDILADNNGTFPGMEQNGKKDFMKNGDVPPPEEMSNEDMQNGQRNGKQFDKQGDMDIYKSKNNGFRLMDNAVSEETPFESRYFTVTVSMSGDYVSSNLDNIASVSAEDALGYVNELYNSKKTAGTYEDYMYRRVDSDGNYMYIFLDCKRDFSSFRSFLLISIIVTVAGELLVFILATILSKIVLRPVFESYDKQKRFITDASHELKTPVAIIKANVEVIEMESGESEWSRSITKQADRLTNLTEKMVLLSRMDEGPKKEEFVDVDASKLFLEVCESYEPIAVKMNKSYNVDIDSDITVRGNDTNLSQMLSLLIDNAFKYSDDGGNVDVTFKRTSKGKVLTVSNSVEEIEEGRHDELFERFVRRDESRNSKTGGFGIGLSVVQAIAESHKAKVSARSNDGKSIEFKVVF